MKIEEEPKYRIKYIECSVKEHQGEKANIVCLEDSCKDKSIICSLCTSEGHLNHQTIPIKFHIDAQHKKYKQFPLDYEKELSVVEQQKNVLLIKLRNTVEEIAEAFMKLEQEIILQYDEIKNHLIQVVSYFFNSGTKKESFPRNVCVFNQRELRRTSIHYSKLLDLRSNTSISVNRVHLSHLQKNMRLNQ